MQVQVGVLATERCAVELVEQLVSCDSMYVEVPELVG